MFLYSYPFPICPVLNLSLTVTTILPPFDSISKSCFTSKKAIPKLNIAVNGIIAAIVFAQKDVAHSFPLRDILNILKRSKKDIYF